MKKLRKFITLAIALAIVLATISIGATQFSHYEDGHSEYYDVLTKASIQANSNNTLTAFTNGLATHRFDADDLDGEEIELHIELAAKNFNTTVTTYNDYGRFGPMYTWGVINFTSQYPNGNITFAANVNKLEGTYDVYWNGEHWQTPAISMNADGSLN